MQLAAASAMLSAGNDFDRGAQFSPARGSNPAAARSARLRRERLPADIPLADRAGLQSLSGAGLVQRFPCPASARDRIDRTPGDGVGVGLVVDRILRLAFFSL
jgi:hypothetical protein